MPRETKEEAADEQDPVAATKKGPGRPRKEVKPGADPADTQPAKGPEANERPRRQAAIRAEEHARREEEEHRGVATAASKSQPEVATQAASAVISQTDIKL